MAKLTFYNAAIHGLIQGADSRLCAGDAYGHLSFAAGYCDEAEDVYFTISADGKTLPEQNRVNLGFSAMVDGMYELEALHAHIGLIINQYKSLPINKK